MPRTLRAMSALTRVSPVLIAALAAVAIELAIQLTLLVSAVVVPFAVIIVLFVGAIGLFFVMFGDRPGRRRWHLDWDEIYGGTSLAVRGAALLLAGLMFIAIAFSVTHLGGQPEIHGGRYYLDNHGSLTQVSHATYLAASRAVDRLFSAAPCVFYTVIILRYWPRSPGLLDSAAR